MSPVIGSLGSLSARGYGLTLAPNYTPYTGTGYVSIASAVCTGGESSITFSSIPQTFTDLEIRISARSLFGLGANMSGEVYFNGNSGPGTNYNWVYTVASGSNTYTVNSDSNSFGYTIRNLYYPTAQNSNTAPGYAKVIIQNYANTSYYKNAIGWSAFANAGTSLAACFSTLQGTWKSTAAITSVTMTIGGGSGFAAGSTIELYGLKVS